MSREIDGVRAGNVTERERLIAGGCGVVCVVGMGYVGLPLALAFARKGFRVVGIDIDQGKVDLLNAGRCYIRHIDERAISSVIANGTFRASSNFSHISECDAILICVPTPLTRHREPDLRFIVATTEAIQPYLTHGQLIVLESTTYPGTTTEVVRPILERSGMNSGRDFFLAFSPEREDPGNTNFDTTSIPKVVGGDGPEALRFATLLYDQIVPRTVNVSSCECAEAVKLTENIFRSVNIALVNELKIVYEKMGIDIWEVIEAAKSKPFGFMPFYPGPGLGGHCIPIDPFYLTWKAREFEVPTRFIELAGEINTLMPYYVVEKLAEALSCRRERALKSARVLVLGIAYKKNIDDMRESPALKIMEILESRGARVEYFDPYVPEIKQTREHAGMTGRKSIEWNQQELKTFDAAIIITDHDHVDYQGLCELVPLVIDTRNATKGVLDSRKVIVKA